MVVINLSSTFVAIGLALVSISAVEGVPAGQLQGVGEKPTLGTEIKDIPGPTHNKWYAKPGLDEIKFARDCISQTQRFLDSKGSSDVNYTRLRNKIKPCTDSELKDTPGSSLAPPMTGSKCAAKRHDEVSAMDYKNLDKDLPQFQPQQPPNIALYYDQEVCKSGGDAPTFAAVVRCAFQNTLRVPPQGEDVKQLGWVQNVQYNRGEAFSTDMFDVPAESMVDAVARLASNCPITHCIASDADHTNMKVINNPGGWSVGPLGSQKFEVTGNKEAKIFTPEETKSFLHSLDAQ